MAHFLSLKKGMNIIFIQLAIKNALKQDKVSPCLITNSVTVMAAIYGHLLQLACSFQLINADRMDLILSNPRVQDSVCTLSLLH